jgi:hypothetical protein
MQTETDVRAKLELELRRPVPDAVWALLLADGLVESALLGSHDDDWPYLVERARAFAALAGSERAIERRPVPVRAPVWPLLAKLQAREASGWVAGFRKAHLGGGALSREQAEAWLFRQERAQSFGDGWRFDSGRNLLTVATTDTEGSGYGRGFLVADDGPLRELLTLARNLAGFYGWDVSDAALYVLTGELAPAAAAGYYSAQQTIGGRWRISLEIDADTAPADVQALYADTRRAVLGAGRRHRPLSPKIVALVDFALDCPEGATWRKRMAAWNAAHPDWAYTQPESMSRDYHRAVKALGFQVEHGRIAAR